MDLAEYIKQRTVQDIYKEAASKEYRRTSVKDRLERIQNDRRHTRNTLLNGYRNITHLSPMTPTPNQHRDLSNVKKVAHNNMREKLAKWKAEKEKRRLEEKKKSRPVFKVSHVPDRIDLPPPPPHIKSKFAPMNHQFVPPKNIKPVEMIKPSSSISKPVEKKLPSKNKKNDILKKMPKTSSTISKSVKVQVLGRDEKNHNIKKIPRTNRLIEKIPPSAGQVGGETLQITKSSSGKENRASSSKKTATSDIEGNKRFGHFLSSADHNGSTSVEPSTRNCSVKTGQKENERSKRKKLSSSIAGSDEEIDLSLNPSKKNTTGCTDSIREPEQQINATMKQKPYLFSKKNNSKDESLGPEKKSKIVRFDSQDSSSNDDVFMTPIKIINRAGVLRIDNGENIILSRPVSAKKYKTTPYRSRREDEIIYIDEEISFKSPAVRSRAFLKSLDQSTTPGFNSGVSTSDSGSSFQCVTKRKPYKNSATRSLSMSRSDLGTPGLIGGLESKFRSSVNSQDSLESASDGMTDGGSIVAPDTKGRSSLIPFVDEVNVSDLKVSKSSEISESSVTRKSLRRQSQICRNSSASSALLDLDVFGSESSRTNEISKIPLTTQLVENVATSDLITFDLESSANSESLATRKSVKTPIKKQDTSFLKRTSDLDVFESPSITMSLRTRLRNRGTSSTQSITSSVSGFLNSQDSNSSDVSERLSTRKSLRTSTKKHITESMKSTASSDLYTSDSNTSKSNEISESPKNRKSASRPLQKNRQCRSPSNMKTSDSEGTLTLDKSFTKTPDIKSTRLPSSNIKTPDQKEGAPSSVYVSPFVTISRGKNSARKEFHVRSSTGGTLPGAEATTSPKAGAQYFDDLLNQEIERIEVMCRDWNEYKETNIPEEAQNMIDVAVGQSKLLISKKMKQFRCLIEQCRSARQERGSVTCQDLHGFWDMLFLQVQDVDKRFDNLKKLKENNWQEVITEKKVLRTKKQRKTKTQASSKIKAMIEAAKKKTKKVQGPQENTCTDLPVILAGVMVDQPQAILSSPRPSHIRKSLTKPTDGVGRSLRASLLTNQLQQKKRNSSPGLVMMSLSQSIKSNDGLTPFRSILKSDQTKSEKRITKTVLFKEDIKEERRFEDV